MVVARTDASGDVRLVAYLALQPEMAAQDFDTDAVLKHLRATLQQFSGVARDGLPVILCSKGVEQGSLKLMTDVAAETLPGVAIAVMRSLAGRVL